METTNISVERFIEVRSAMVPAFAQDGSRLYFLFNMTGTPQVWTLSDHAPWPRQMTFFPDRVMEIHVAPAGHRLCISADRGGTENAQLFIADEECLEIHDITCDEAHMYNFGGWSADGKQLTYSSNRRNGRDFDLYVYDLERDAHRLLYSSAHMNVAHGFTPDGRAVLMSREHTNLDHELYLVDVKSGVAKLITPHTGEAQYECLRFIGDGTRLYLTTDQDSEFMRVAVMYVANGDLALLSDDNWDAETLAVSEDGAKIAYSRNIGGTSELVVRRSDTGEVLIVEGLPVGAIEQLCWQPASQERLVVALNSPLFGQELWSVDLSATASDGVGALVSRLTYAAMSGLPNGVTRAPELIEYASFDGRKIPAFYYRPDGPGPHSVIVYVHGGPESQMRNDFNPALQYFLHRGYAVLAPNVRGSSGYGKVYIHLDDVRKRMDSVADLTYAAKWLVEHGKADVSRIAVMGRSYGGFMVLAAVTHYPEVWAAGIDIVGIGHFRTFMENTSPYRRHLREAEYGSIENDGAFFDEIAPILRVGDIQCPMFVTHGANDPRVPISEAETMVAGLRERDHPVEYIRLEDEGHGMVKLANRIRVFSGIAQFLDRHVGTDR